MSGDKTKLPKEIVQHIIDNSPFFARIRYARPMEEADYTCAEQNRYEPGVCGKPATSFVIGFGGFQILPVCEEHAARHRKRAEITNGMEVVPIEQEKKDG